MQKLKQAIAKMLNAKHYNQKTIDRLNQMTEQSYKMTNKPLFLCRVRSIPSYRLLSSVLMLETYKCKTRCLMAISTISDRTLIVRQVPLVSSIILYATSSKLS